ncbi:hypothetical protein [Robiginitomaculum antarcticum]|uniref:hypothetical protein n=1 Tax=Robiginitomaculum antarcticum TaxID=437507 RepID=UPI0012E9B66A|nr:hypothetical protein [Robiginitomaculum antarcticum]
MSLAKKSVSDTRRGIPDALRAPFRDFNLMKRSIPAVLQRITYPYAINGPVHCTALIIEINALNSVLGNSADVSALENSRPEQIAEAASNAATNAIEDAATGWIPYRSIIRRITGAHQYEREIRKAYERGRIRRAFLKGVGGAYGCAYPARPSSVKEPMRIIVPPESPIRPVDREPPPTRVLPEKYRQKR